MRRVRFMGRAGLTLIGLALSLGASAVEAEVVAVVSVSNPLTSLSRNQAVDIFLGKAGRFPDGSRAVPVDQAEGSPARDEFYSRFAGQSPAQIKAHWSKIIFTGRGLPPMAVANGADVKKRIAGNPDAIGYIDRGMIDASVKVLLVQ